MSETKLDNTVYDSEVTIDGYNIARSDKNRKGGGVACLLEAIFISIKNLSLFFHKQNQLR